MMLSLGLGLLATANAMVGQPIDPPRSVNDSVLGTAEQFATAGPAQVCLGRTVISVEAGETAYLHYLGIHWGGIRVIGPRGTFLVMEGDSWAEPRNGRVVPDLWNRTVMRVRQDGRPRYLIYAPTSYDPSRERPTVWVEGDALGRSRDWAILNRIRINPDAVTSCDRHFDYGWEFLLGDREGSEEE